MGVILLRSTERGNGGKSSFPFHAFLWTPIRPAKNFVTCELSHVRVRPCAFYRVSFNIAYFPVAYCGL